VNTAQENREREIRIIETRLKNPKGMRDILYPGLRALEEKYGVEKEMYVDASNSLRLGDHVLVTEQELLDGVTMHEVAARLKALFEPKPEGAE
jgi:hypothetical protein